MRTLAPKLKMAAFAAAGLTLAACAAPVPDSGAAMREAQLTGTMGGFQPPAGGAIASSELSAAGIGGAQPGFGTTGGADLERRAGVQASPSNASPSISDEQSFEAVSNRETIQSDAERRAQQAAAYQVIQPTALPQRSENGPNLVEYALNAPNQRGQEWYSRFILGTWGNRFERNCAGYNSPDEAQRDFLSRGGPERDPRGIDPDGDGFACGWDPAPFRAAVGR
ncbi:hypothetical protein [Limimaricola pyoseonensis]|uniref:hypothetical protein n=1 Tax=Limimaricola pyoseonensis TaxID=521013 RepID=UPI000B7C854E|nr:hypothetical protein [Limimaricola pyoseonensis]